jgi:PAS domain S-box-containing protein
LFPNEHYLQLPLPKTRLTRESSVLARYLASTGATLLAALLTYVFWLQIRPSVSLIFFVAVLFASWYGGLRPGLICAALSTIASNLILGLPHGELRLGPDDLFRLSVFMLASVFVSALTMAQQNAQQAKEKAQKHLAMTLKSIGEAVITTDSRGRVKFMNSVAETLTGWSSADARTRAIEEVLSIVDQENHVDVERLVRRVLRENAVIGLGKPALLLTRDGMEVPVDEIAHPVRDGEGTIIEVVLVVRNISHTSTQTQNKDELLKERIGLLDAVSATIFAVDLHGRCMFISKSAAELLGYSPQDLIGHDLYEMTRLPEQGARDSRGFSLTQGVPGDVQIESLAKRNGTPIFVELSSAPMFLDETLYGTVVTIKDLTEQHRSTEAIAKLDSIMEHIPEAVIWHNLDGLITGWSRSAERLYGYTEKEVLGRHLSIIHPPGHQEEFAELFDRAIGRKEVVEWPDTLRVKKGGEQLRVRITANPVTNAAGAVHSVTQIVRPLDLTELQQAATSAVSVEENEELDENQSTPVVRSKSYERAPRVPARKEVVRSTQSRPSALIVGSSPTMMKLNETIDRIAGTDSSIMITGATGTGKELVARAIHERSRRAGGPFVDLNCSAIPETLIEAELFGHQRGTFTGANENRPGLFEIASGGTVFLDEVDALNLAAQAKLLRVIQERCVRRIGGRSNIAVDVRIISATNCDLAGAVNDNRFRADLYYRLRVVPVHVPELCKRPGDVELLIQHFLARHSERYGVAQRRFSDGAMKVLLEYPWPGNVRELENTIEYALAIAKDDEELEVDALPLEIRTRDLDGSPENLSELLQAYTDGTIPLAEIERRYILSVLQHFGGNQVKAAAALGIDRSKLYRRLKQYGVRAVKFLQDEDQDGLQMRSGKSQGIAV